MRRSTLGSAVIFTDTEEFLTRYIRAKLAAIPGQPYKGSFISNEFYSPEPQAPRDPPPFQIIVRDDGGPRTGVVTKNITAGVTVLGSDAKTKQPTTELALLVAAIVEDCAAVEDGNPVAAVTGSTGPIKVVDLSGQPRRYMTFAMVVTGEPYIP